MFTRNTSPCEPWSLTKQDFWPIGFQFYVLLVFFQSIFWTPLYRNQACACLGAWSLYFEAVRYSTLIGVMVQHLDPLYCFRCADSGPCARYWATSSHAPLSLRMSYQTWPFCRVSVVQPSVKDSLYKPCHQIFIFLTNHQVLNLDQYPRSYLPNYCLLYLSISSHQVKMPSQQLWRHIYRYLRFTEPCLPRSVQRLVAILQQMIFHLLLLHNHLHLVLLLWSLWLDLTWSTNEVSLWRRMHLPSLVALH